MTDRSNLAEEYVLGTLDDAERRHFEGELRRDESLQELVVLYHDILQPTLLSVPEVRPSQEIKDRLMQNLDLASGLATAQAVATDGVVDLSALRASRNKWRGFSAALSALAAGLIGFTLMDTQLLDPPMRMPQDLAVLTSSKFDIQIVASIDPGREGVHIRPIIAPNAQDPFADGPLQLWVRKGGQFVSLGAVTSRKWQWLDYSSQLETDDFRGAELVLTRPIRAGETPQTEPQKILFEGPISSPAVRQ